MQSALQPGDSLGRYEIRSKLGEGGMGVVYLAFDPNIGRNVAIKVLPSSFSADEERLERFRQEAQAVGALNHSNILSIYDIDAENGTPYVVFELLEGETLRELLHETTLAPRKAVDYALQIVRGLAAVHDKGIIHRDLKPENIFVTTNGRVKILDFGLAKLADAFFQSEAQTNVQTRKFNTEPGMIVGTLGYMSPEQLRGDAVDHRTDIFSFGAIVYEMLSGKFAFQRDSQAETIGAILKEDPPELALPNSNVAPALERIARHCLEKNRADRFQSTHDLAFDLESLAQSPPRGTTTEAVNAPQSKRRLWPLVVVGLALIAAASLAAFLAGKRTGASVPPKFRQLTFRLGSIYSARFANDGQMVVYGAAWDGGRTQLYSTRPESPESRSLGLPGGDIFAISAQGEMAISLGSPVSFGGTLAQAPLAGGAPREVVENVEYADWSPKDESLAVVRRVEGKDRLEFPVGKVLYETTGWISNPRVSREGDAVGFFDHPTLGDYAGQAAVVDLAGKKTVLTNKFPLVEGLAWSAGGDEIWFTAGEGGVNTALYGVTLAGKQRVLLRGTGQMSLADVSRDGRVLVVQHRGRAGMLCLPPGETRERDLYWFDYSRAVDISADGRTLLFNEGGEAGGVNYTVYLRKTDGSPAVRLGEGYATSLSADGKWVLAHMQGSPAQLRLLPTGAGEPKDLTRDSIHHLHDAFNFDGAHWLPDFKRFIFTGNEPGHSARCYVQDTEGGSPRAVTPEGTIGGQVTPDGKFVAAIDPEQRVVLYPLDGAGEARPVPGVNAGELPVRWSADGRSLYVFRPYELPAKVFRVDATSGRRELWKELMPADPTGVASINPIVMTPDGKSYAYSFERLLSELYLVEGLK